MLINVEEVLGKRVLILGEMGSGKTRLTAEILDELLKKVNLEDITVIDMAPTTVPGIGERISSYTVNTSRVRYLAPRVVRAPRMEGKDRDEVLNLADFNRASIETLIQRFLDEPTPILFINDLSIYLHSGNLLKIMKCLELPKTVVTNSYYSMSPLNDKGSGISVREKRLVEMLAKNFDKVLRL